MANAAWKKEEPPLETLQDDPLVLGLIRMAGVLHPLAVQKNHSCCLFCFMRHCLINGHLCHLEQGTLGKALRVVYGPL